MTNPQVRAYEAACEAAWQSHLKRLEPEGGLHPDFVVPFKTIFTAGFYGGWNGGLAASRNIIDGKFPPKPLIRDETLWQKIRRWFV